MTQVAHHGERLEKNFRKDDGGPIQEYDPALQLRQLVAEDPEIAIAGLADGCAIGFGMLVDGFRAQRDVYGDWHLLLETGQQQALLGMLEGQGGKLTRHRLPITPSLRGSFADRLVDQNSGLLHVAEAPGFQVGGNVLRGAAEQGHLEVMNDTGTIHDKARDGLAFDQLDE